MTDANAAFRRTRPVNAITVPCSMLRPSLRTSTGYMSTGIWLPFHVATPTTKDNSPTPLIRLLVSLSSSTRSMRRPAARSMPLSRNSESSVTWPLANSCAIPEGWAWVMSSCATSCVTSSSGDGDNPRRYCSRQPRIRSSAPVVSLLSLMCWFTSLSLYDIPRIRRCGTTPHRCPGPPTPPAMHTNRRTASCSWQGTAAAPDAAPFGTAR